MLSYNGRVITNGMYITIIYVGVRVSLLMFQTEIHTVNTIQYF